MFTPFLCCSCESPFSPSLCFRSLRILREPPDLRVRRLRLAAPMAISRVVLAASIIIGGATMVGAQPATPEALDQGFQALQNGEADKAASVFREALTRHP